MTRTAIRLSSAAAARADRRSNGVVVDVDLPTPGQRDNAPRFSNTENSVHMPDRRGVASITVAAPIRAEPGALLGQRAPAEAAAYLCGRSRFYGWCCRASRQERPSPSGALRLQAGQW